MELAKQKLLQELQDENFDFANWNRLYDLSVDDILNFREAFNAFDNSFRISIEKIAL